LKEEELGDGEGKVEGTVPIKDLDRWATEEEVVREKLTVVRGY